MKTISSKRVLWTSFIVDFLDILLNVTVGILSGSAILIAEACQGMTDLLTSGSLLIGYNSSKKRASSSFQFGYGKEIYFWTLIAAFLMFFVTGSLSFYFGYQHFINPQPIRSIGLVVLVLLIALITNSYAFILSVARLRKNSSINNFWSSFFGSALIEIKTALILDLMGASAAFLGLVNIFIYLKTGDARFDGIGAISVGVIIILFSLFIIYELRKFITGRGADRETVLLIKNSALVFEDVNEISNLKTMYLGSEKLIINFDITVDKNMIADRSIDLADKIKEKIRQNIRNAYYIQIELAD